MSKTVFIINICKAHEILAQAVRDNFREFEELSSSSRDLYSPQLYSRANSPPASSLSRQIVSRWHRETLLAHSYYFIDYCCSPCCGGIAALRHKLFKFTQIFLLRKNLCREIYFVVVRLNARTKFGLPSFGTIYLKNSFTKFLRKPCATISVS